MASSPTSIWKRIRPAFLPRATWPAISTRFLTSGAGWSTGTTPFLRGSTGRPSLAASDGLMCTCLTSSRTSVLSYELLGDSEGATQTIVRGDASSSSFSVWWLKRDCLIAAFVMNRPDEEREVAPAWIQSKQTISAERLQHHKRSVKEAV